VVSDADSRNASRKNPNAGVVVDANFDVHFLEGFNALQGKSWHSIGHDMRFRWNTNVFEKVRNVQSWTGQ
jgi:hypothetical protein